jgi:hypothetical protein
MYNLPQINSNITKTQLSLIAETTIGDIIGNGNCIDALDTFVKMEYLIKEIRGNKEFIELVRDEISKHGKSMTTTTGVKIELAEVGTTYDFDDCNDPEYNELVSLRDYYEDELRKRKDYLKSLPKPMEILTKEGEVIQVHPPIKTSKSSFKTTLSK